MARLDKTLLDMDDENQTKEMVKRLRIGTYYILNDWEDKFIDSMYKRGKDNLPFSPLMMDKVKEIYTQKG